MKTNIVMLTKARPQLLGQTLHTLYKNTDPALYNLTLIDDESRESVVNRYRIGENATVLRIEKSHGITGQARNLGVYWAEKYWGRGDYLYLSDDDVFFTPGWLQTLIATFEAYSHELNGNFKLMGGWNHPYMRPTYCGKNINFTVASHDAVAGPSQLIRWSTWDKYGPLDAHAKGVCQGEDWQFCQNIIKDGGRVGSVYPRVVWNCGVTNSHGTPSTGADVVLQELQQAKMTYPDLYWQ